LTRADADTSGVRRIFRQRIANALDSMPAAKLSDRKIHAARKELKKARATLRLMQDALSKAAYKRENTALRDSSRPLSEVRDGKAMLSALEALIERYGAAARGLPINALKRSLRRDRSDARGKMLNGAKGLKPVRAALRKASRRAARWPRNGDGWKVIGKGFTRTYRKGFKALAAVRATPSMENLHEWRKQVKYLWHQLQVLRPLWPGMLGELADQAHKLAKRLGDNHDLAVLREKAMECEEKPSDAAARSALIALIDRRRAELRDKAFILGQRIYGETPKQFSARFSRYWQDWKSQPESC
jgi:CHAD domain-containing protein